VKVLDFGIAKLTDGAGGGKTQGVFGTPSYMSPEQCASAAAVDGRSDLYALGCIFYELVCGRPPFGHGGLELIAAHLRDVPPPPRAIAPWVPPAIEQVILRLLEKQPGQRYPSCAALIAAIDEAVRASGLPAVSSPHLPAASASMPAMHDPRAGYAGSPSTLGGAAAAVMSPAAPRRGLGAWFGLGTVVIVGGAVAAVTVLGGGPKVGGAGPARSDAGVVAVVAVDAAAAVGAPVDAVAAAVVREDPSAVREEPVVAREEPAVVPRRERVEPAKDPTDRKRTIERTGGTLAGARVAAQDPAGPAAQTTPPSTDPPASTSSSVRDVATTSAPAPAKLDPADEAQALNEQGKTDMLAKRYDEASAAFRKAYALAPRGQYLLNIAVSEIQRGDCRAAKDDLLLLRKRWPDFSPDKVDRLMVKADSCR
jgi:hypothetical protein